MPSLVRRRSRLRTSRGCKGADVTHRLGPAVNGDVHVRLVLFFFLFRSRKMKSGFDLYLTCTISSFSDLSVFLDFEFRVELDMVPLGELCSGTICVLSPPGVTESE